LNTVSDCVFASSYRAVAELMAQTGVNPLAAITDLIGDAPELARRSVPAVTGCHRNPPRAPS
jgi:hypothetical protein